MSPQWLVVASVGSGLVVLIADRVLHPGRKVMKRLEEFFEDWNGMPERRTPDGKAVLRNRQPGVPERLEKIESQLNGGGLGSKMAALESKVTEHIGSADIARDDLSSDIRAVKEQVGEVQRFSFRLAQGQERLEAKVDTVNDTLGGRMVELEESERTHRAMLHELGMPVGDDGSDGGGG